jgi:hypothetical protein
MGCALVDCIGSCHFLTKRNLCRLPISFQRVRIVSAASPSASEEAATSGHMTFEQAYDYDVVVISAVFAIASVYAVIHLAGPASGPGRWRRIAWLAAGTAILGGGLRIAQDFGLPVFRSQILYHYSTVRLVTLATVISSTAAIRTAKRENAARANTSVSKLWQKPSLRLSGLPMLPAGPPTRTSAGFR